MHKNSNKIGMYRIIILSCSLPEKKDELGVLAIFFFSPSSWANLLLDGMFACDVYVYAFVIRMKKSYTEIMGVYFMKYCLTSKVQKKRNLWTLIQSFGMKVSNL